MIFSLFHTLVSNAFFFERIVVGWGETSGLLAGIFSSSAGWGSLNAVNIDTSRVLSRETIATALTLAGIFGLRILNVSAAVMRVMFLVRSRRWLAGFVGFFESITWLFAAVAVLNSLDTPLKAIAYAGGFAAGTVVGSWVEEKLAVGSAVLRIFISEGNPSPVEMLREQGWGVTEVAGEGMQGPVTILFTVIPRKRIKDVMVIVRDRYPRAYVTVESISTIDPMHRKFQKSRG